MVELPRPLSPATGVQPIQRRTPEDEREQRRQQNQLKKNDPDKNKDHAPSNQPQTTNSADAPTVGRKVDTYA